jgi:hypothetical protein
MVSLTTPSSRGSKNKNTKFAPNSSLQPNQQKPFTYPGGAQFNTSQLKTTYPKPQKLNTFTPIN